MSGAERLGQVELREGDMTVYEHPDGFRTLYVRGGAMAVTIDLTHDQAAVLATLLIARLREAMLFDLDDTRLLLRLIEDRLHGAEPDNDPDAPALEQLRLDLMDTAAALGGPATPEPDDEAGTEPPL